MKSLSELRALPHTSVSAIKTFVQCPRKYRLNYVDKVEFAFRPIALAIGTVWHDVLGHWLGSATTGSAATPEELRERLRTGIEAAVNADGPPVLFDDAEQNLAGTIDLASRMLDAFLREVVLPEKTLGIEVPFSLQLSDPDTGELLPVPLVGAMDAIVIEGGCRMIWELKTAKQRYSADQLCYDLQSTAYRLGAHDDGPIDVDVKLIVVTKARAPVVQVERLKGGLQAERDLQATAASVLRAVAAGVDHPIRGWACRGCPVAHACR
jgi:CRISPR/Cas system-associated exonuclease Cas4 (RecB family)